MVLITNRLRTYVGFLMISALFSFSMGDKEMLFDFTKTADLTGWREISDTIRTMGKSKAVLTLQTTQLFQRAIFFTLLNPQANGAGFAGVERLVNLNLSTFENIQVRCRGQGSNDHYKLILRHKGKNSEVDPTYEQFFTVTTSSEEFLTVVLPLDKFKAYFHGRELPDEEPLDKRALTGIGFQIYGGVYSPIKQHGVSALEIETIVASRSLG